MNHIIKNKDFTPEGAPQEKVRETEMNSILRNEFDYWHEATQNFTTDDWLKDPDRYFQHFYFRSSGQYKLLIIKQLIHDNLKNKVN